MPLVLPLDRDLDKITWVSNTHEKATHVILCQGCKGIIEFSGPELTGRRAAGQSTSTPCRHCGWHPGWPPEPWLEIPPDGILSVDQRDLQLGGDVKT